MKHRSMKLLGGRVKQYFSEQRTVNLAAVSQEVSWRSTCALKCTATRTFSEHVNRTTDAHVRHCASCE